MTTTAQFMEATVAPRGELRIADASRVVIRTIQRLSGAALAFAAVGLWLAPGSSMESDLLLFKLILSLVAIIAGIGLMQASSSGGKTKVEIDTIRREVRVKHPAMRGADAFEEQCTFGELVLAEQLGNHFRLWGKDRTLLAEVTLRDRKALNSLVAGLRDAGKLA